MNSFERPTVLVDMDNVLADFDGRILEMMADRHPHIPLLGVRKNFYVSEDYPEHTELVLKLSDEQGFFEGLSVIEHALEGWQRLIDLGYHPRVCSAPLSTNPFSIDEKIRWLEREFAPAFGRYVVDEAIIDKRKHLYNGVALIDDRPVVDLANVASWEHIVFDQPYNRHVPTPRMHGWLDPELPNLLLASA